GHHGPLFPFRGFYRREGFDHLAGFGEGNLGHENDEPRKTEGQSVLFGRKGHHHFLSDHGNGPRRQVDEHARKQSQFLVPHGAARIVARTQSTIFYDQSPQK